jgi:SAM-dependent methyltransferase
MPRAYAEARRARALLHWLAARARSAVRPVETYDDAFWDFHSGGDWAGLTDTLVALAAPRSLIDVGCGQGLLLAALKARHPLVRGAGLESSTDAIRRARERGLDITCVDLAFLGTRSAKIAARLVDGFDMAVCLETAEHLPPWSASPLVHVLTRAPMVLFSAAPPGQGGTSHINEQPHEYWRKRFLKHGFDLDPRDEALRNAVARLDLPWWYAANIHLYSRR